MGVISAMDSVTVNGVRYETDSTTVMINGQLASLADLELGQIVSLEGMIEVDGPGVRPSLASSTIRRCVSFSASAAIS